jgi:hypothetical protein
MRSRPRRRHSSVLRPSWPIIYLLSVAILSITVWQLVRWGVRIQSRGETTPGTLKLPKYPFAYVAAFGMLTLVPIYVSRLLRAVGELLAPSPGESEAKP